MLQIRFSTRPVSHGAVAVLVADPSKWNARAAELDRATGGQLTRACRATGFAALAGEVCEVLAPTGLGLSRVLIVGAGRAALGAQEAERIVGAGRAPSGALEAKRIRGARHATLRTQEAEHIGGAIGAHFSTRVEPSIAIDIDTLEGNAAERAVIAAHVALGFRLRSYRFDRYRSQAATDSSSRQLTVITDSAKDARRAFIGLEAIAQGVELARDLVTEPPNVLHPVAFAGRAKELAGLGIRVEVLGATALRKLGFGALLGVAQGSQFEPQVVVCEYDGSRGNRRNRGSRSESENGKSASRGTRGAPLILAGKGVTFDAGGINIKPSAGLETLKQDMGGAASIIGVMKTLALREARCHVVGICGLVENMPSGTAQRPGDVVVSHSGKTVEIINTDAEGRLVLCDLLWYAQERYRPKVIIDMATLTGAIAIALGEDYAGLFSNNDELAARLVDAGNATGDRVWRYPMGESYDRQLDSLIADMKNLGADKGRSIIAAQFIQRFVQKGVAWAHVDFGMKVWAERDTPLAPEGATGFGVRLLDRLIADHFEER